MFGMFKEQKEYQFGWNLVTRIEAMRLVGALLRVCKLKFQLKWK